MATTRTSRNPATLGHRQPLSGLLPEFVLNARDLAGPGRVYVELQVPGWCQPGPIEATLDEGRESDVAIQLVPGGGLLEGTRDAKVGTRITLTYPRGLQRTLLVDQRGKWLAGFLAPGTYTLEPDGASPVSVSVADGDHPQVVLSSPEPR